MLLPLHCASVCALHEDSWKLKFVSLLLLGHWTLDAFVVVQTFVVSIATREAPIQLWVVPRVVVVKAPVSA